MPKRLFTGQDLALAERIAEIVYCNPFEERRWDLEKECLGSDYVDRTLYVPAWKSPESLAPNLTALIDMAKTVLERGRSKLLKAPSDDWLAKDLSTYESVTHFLVYHTWMKAFDELIEGCMEGKRMPSRVAFFFKCIEQLRHYLSVDDRLRLSAEGEGKFFAFYFQLRRAWLNIYSQLVGQSDAIMCLRGRIWESSFTWKMDRYQRSLYDRMGDVVTLISGPSGSGKELVARAVGLSRFIPFEVKNARFEVNFHDAFYPLNLSALSPTLIESELFGHQKGAFTGALQERAGYFEDCGRYGTVFLDEIGETDPSIQVKLLRVLQTRQFQRLGDTQLRPFVGKVMAATNRDLSVEIEKGSFREDFYYRLCADRIETPALIDMLNGADDELDCLVESIAYRIAGSDEGAELADESSRWIRGKLGPGYKWPGNFRELEQCVRNIMIRGSYEPERVDSIGRGSPLKEAVGDKLNANQLLSRYAQLLYREEGSYESVAKTLQVDRRTAKRYVLGVE